MIPSRATYINRNEEPMDIETLSKKWLQAKAFEKRWQMDRRAVEDELAEVMRVNNGVEGAVKTKVGPYNIKATVRHNKKIDGDKLQDIAAENGTSEHLSKLFQWKPSIAKKVWDATDSSITAPLLDAIITTPGRPTFSITEEKD